MTKGMCATVKALKINSILEKEKQTFNTIKYLKQAIPHYFLLGEYLKKLLVILKNSG